MAGSDECGGSQIAAAIAKDHALNADVLWLANSFYSRSNPAGANIAAIEDAVLRVGQKRIGEFALAAGAFTRAHGEADLLAQRRFGMAAKHRRRAWPSICSFRGAFIRVSATACSSAR